MAQSDQVFRAPFAQKIVFTILMVLSILVCADHTRRWFIDLPPDLRAFVAGGQVVNQFASPFTVQPLLGAEQKLAASPTEQGIVAPVPLPPYDLAIFSMLARLPIAATTAIMAALTLGAGCVTALALYRSGALPLPLAVAFSFMTTIYDASGLGQIAPIAIAGIAVAVWAVRSQRYQFAAVGLGVALIQPQIALAPCLGLFLFVPRARPAALLCAVFGISLSFIMLDPATIAAYVHTLGIHARAELHFPAQLSLTWFAGFLGASPDVALALGGASTVVMTALGLAVVARHRAAAVANGAVIAVPAACAVVGGSFLHGHQVALAIVPALLLLRTTKSYVDSTLALAVLCLPFMELLTLEPFWPRASAYPSVLVAFAVAWSVAYMSNMVHGNAFALRKASFVTISLACVFGLLAHMRPTASFAIAPVQHIAMQNASLEWALFCNAADVALHSEWFVFFAKLPIWISAITIAVCASRNVEKIA